MTASDEDFWHQFDKLDRKRRQHHKQRQDALRNLSPSTARPDDAAARSAWEEYCQSVNDLEASIEELERLIWRM